jgi:serine/threonine-protein kinase
MAQGNEAEMEFWRAIKDSDDPEELELYIEQFPQGVYVELARRKIAELGG